MLAVLAALEGVSAEQRTGLSSTPSLFLFYSSAWESIFSKAAACCRFQRVEFRADRIASVSASCLALVTCSRIAPPTGGAAGDRKSTRLNSSHLGISYAVFC